MVDAIVDVVSPVAVPKLKRNLKAGRKIADISARLIVNQAAFKTKRDALMPIVEILRNQSKRVLEAQRH